MARGRLRRIGAAVHLEPVEDRHLVGLGIGADRGREHRSTPAFAASGISHADCSITTAAAVIQGPDAAGGQCGLYAQAYIADGAIAGYLDGAHYLKIACASGTRPPAAATPPARSTALAAE
jgi:hypothetical protein